MRISETFSTVRLLQSASSHITLKLVNDCWEIFNIIIFKLYYGLRTFSRSSAYLSAAARRSAAIVSKLGAWKRYRKLMNAFTNSFGETFFYLSGVDEPEHIGHDIRVYIGDIDAIPLRLLHVVLEHCRKHARSRSQYCLKRNSQHSF